MNNGYFETLAATVDGAMHEADMARVLLAEPLEAREQMLAEPISYNQVRNFDFAIKLYKNCRTKKYFHVVITRLDSGRYELVTYVL